MREHPSGLTIAVDRKWPRKNLFSCDRNKWTGKYAESGPVTLSPPLIFLSLSLSLSLCMKKSLLHFSPFVILIPILRFLSPDFFACQKRSRRRREKEKKEKERTFSRLVFVKGTHLGAVINDAFNVRFLLLSFFFFSFEREREREREREKEGQQEESKR